MKLSRSMLGIAAILLLVGAGDSTGAAALYFPPAEGEWETVTPESFGLNSDKLQLALDYAGKNLSSGVVILHKGRILAEQYWDAKDKASAKYGQRTVGLTKAGQAIEDIASAQKSVVSIMVGIAQEKGLLNIGDPVDKYLGVGWSKATREQEHAITIRHLITMSSGLGNRGSFEAKAGTKWYYNTWVYAKTVDVLEKASGMDRHELTRKWLTEPVGMLDSKWVRRGSPKLQDLNGWGFAASARDLARFGLMVLAKGEWDGKTILVDQEYLSDATKTSQKMNPFYGYLWWVNQDANSPQKKRRSANVPMDMFSANGALNRRCWIVPSRQLVVVRIGDQPTEAKRRFDTEFWRLLKAAQTGR